MTAKTPIYMQDELEHANKMRERMVPQIEAARAMLAALYEIARASTVGEENPERLLKAWRQVNDAVILAEAAGIGEE